MYMQKMCIFPLALLSVWVFYNKCKVNIHRNAMEYTYSTKNSEYELKTRYFFLTFL